MLDNGFRCSLLRILQQKIPECNCSTDQLICDYAQHDGISFFPRGRLEGRNCILFLESSVDSFVWLR